MEVVGLKNFVQDDINKLIFKFVGFRHPVAEILNSYIISIQRNARNPKYTVKDALHFILVWKKGGLIHTVFKTYWKLKQLKSQKVKRDEFMKLQRWLRYELLNNSFYSMRIFADSKINHAFLREQRDTFP